MNLLNDTPGGVGIKAEVGSRVKWAEKAETVRIFEKTEKEGGQKENQKNFKKTLKKVLRFSEF